MPVLNRVSRDICFFGSKGSGKTLAMTYYGYRHLLGGGRVASNYNLKYPHYRLYNIEDIYNVRDSLVLMDDLEGWLSSRQYKSKQNLNVMDIILQWGKRRNTCLYSAKRPENVDLLLRDTTDFWCRCSMIPNFVAKTQREFYDKCNHLENLLIRIEVFNDNVDPVNTTYIGNLDVYADLYDTQEEIAKLGFNEKAKVQ